MKTNNKNNQIYIENPYRFSLQTFANRVHENTTDIITSLLGLKEAYPLHNFLVHIIKPKYYLIYAINICDLVDKKLNYI